MLTTYKGIYVKSDFRRKKLSPSKYIVKIAIKIMKSQDMTFIDPQNIIKNIEHYISGNLNINSYLATIRINKINATKNGRKLNIQNILNEKKDVNVNSSSRSYTNLTIINEH